MGVVDPFSLPLSSGSVITGGEQPQKHSLVSAVICVVTWH